MIGAAMTSVLHEDARLEVLIEDFKTLFPMVLNNAATAPKTKKTPKVPR
jgi:hypothetical protein